MNPKCRTQLDAARVAAGGRPLTDAQAAAIEDRLRSAGRYLAGSDPLWRSYSADQRHLLAAQHAASEIKADADRKVELARLQVLKRAEFAGRIDKNMAELGLSKPQAVAKDYQQTDDRISALAGEYSSRMMEVIEAGASTQGVGLGRWALMKVFDAQNPQMTKDLAVEIHAQGKGGTGNKLAIDAAKAWNENVSEPMRQRFNAAGGDVGRLDYGYMPTMWEPELVLKAGADKFAERILPHLDRKRYVREDGSPMDDGEVLALLRAAGETIGSDGANRMAPGAFKGDSARANRGREHRQIHFKDGAAYIEAMREFGSGSMYDAMMGHVHMLARDIALVERYGPNPNAQHALVRQEIQATDKAGLASMVTAADLNHHWSTLAGSGVSQWRLPMPSVLGGDITGAGFSRFMGHARNVETFSKLQGAVLSSMTDVPTYFAAMHMNKLPILEGIANIPRAFASNTPGLRALYKTQLGETMNMMGMASDTVLRGINRFTGENAAAAWSGKLSAATMRLGLVNWWTDSLRQAYSLTMQHAMARNVATPWDSLDEYMRVAILGRNGITKEHWSVLQQVQQVNGEWGRLLTPESIYATGHPLAAETANAYLAFLRNRQETAVLNPDVAARAFWRRSSESGSAGGEISRAISQFQMFPTSMFTRLYREVLQNPRELEGAPAGFGDTPFNRLAFLGSSIAALTFFGALSIQAKQVKDGKDPLDMTTAKFWTRALGQGGGFGYVSGLLLDDTSDARSTSDPLFRMAGPLAGSVAQAYELTKGNIDEAAAGKDTHAGAEAFKFARDHAPLLNLWYAKAALDHAGLHALQESLSPGYLSRIQNKARKDWSNEYWWRPGTGLPERAPSFADLAGQ